MTEQQTIFHQLFDTPEKLVDRHLLQPELEPVDVIIPIINTNPLFRRNLFNIFERVPIRRLIIGDGGCTDGSLDIAREFPRVQIVDQHQYKSLGKCIVELMDHVESDWFIYFHADVFLPEGWYDVMCKYRHSYDWFESSQRNVVLADFWTYDHSNWKATRAFSGAQMGRRQALQTITPIVDDDFLQRQEDAIISHLVENAGFKYGRVSETFIHHELMDKRGAMEPKLISVAINREEDPAWQERMYDMQIKGYLKYCKPTDDMRLNVLATLESMASLKLLNEKDLINWINENCPIWLPTVQEYISIARDYQRILRARSFVKKVTHLLLKMIRFGRGPINT